MATKESEPKVQSGYVDNWQKEKSVIESLRYSLEEKILCDVTFIVGENRKRIQAHRLILSLRSCVFLAMLTGPLAEQDDIEIPDIEDDVFDQFLQFLYTDVIAIDGRNVIGLLYASKKYDIFDMENKCLTYIASSSSIKDVCFVMEQAHLYNEQDLLQKALAYIWRNGDAVLKSGTFCDLCHDCFVKIIQADELKTSAESVFEASITWSEAECSRQGREVTPENRRSVLGDSVHLIRYSKIKPNYFVQKVSQSSVLTEAEENKILRSFIIRSEDVSPLCSRCREGTNKTVVEINRFGNIKSTYTKSESTTCECIDFCLDTSTELHGFKLYGSTTPSSDNTSYFITASVCDATTDELVSGSSVQKEISSNKVIFDVDFPHPVQLSENLTYSLVVKIKRKTGYNMDTCQRGMFGPIEPRLTEHRNFFNGIQGKRCVRYGAFTCSFYDHKKCKHCTGNNNTCVNTGQIPCLKLLL